MGEITDKNGNLLTVGDTIRIGNNEHGLLTIINGFTTMDGGSLLLAKTNYGDFNVTIVEKVL